MFVYNSTLTEYEKDHNRVRRASERATCRPIRLLIVYLQHPVTRIVRNCIFVLNLIDNRVGNEIPGRLKFTVEKLAFEGLGQMDSLLHQYSRRCLPNSPEYKWR